MSNRPEPTASRLEPAVRRRVRARLLRWYDAGARDLPWRGERDPYRIWISEAMLQQTRAETVRARYGRFLERFPTLRALADAPLGAVLAEWQGLGYYGRARSLHRAARALAEANGGRLPRARAALLALPGFGPYTAAAVASIAFGERAAAVDGNAARALSRLLDLAEPADAPAGKKILEGEAGALVPPSRPGDFNQALMELGARVCLPKKPRCEACPLEKLCAARAAGTVPLRPVRSRRRPPREVTLFQLWAERAGALRLVRREEDGLFGGLWELPGWMEDGRKEGAHHKTLEKKCRELLGPGWRPAGGLARTTRTLTHRRIRFLVYRAAEKKKGRGSAPRNKEEENALWADAEALAALPLSAAQRAAIAAARAALASPQKRHLG